MSASFYADLRDSQRLKHRPRLSGNQMARRYEKPNRWPHACKPSGTGYMNECRSQWHSIFETYFIKFFNLLFSILFLIYFAFYPSLFSRLCCEIGTKPKHTGARIMIAKVN